MKKQIIGYVEIPLEGFDGKPAKKLVLPVYAALKGFKLVCQKLDGAKNMRKGTSARN
jgi:hypothetical protein